MQMVLLRLLGVVTANVVSNAKPANIPIFAFTNSKIVHRQLSMVGSVQSSTLEA